MICWECEKNCITVYLIRSGRWVVTPNEIDGVTEKILAVRKDCLNCEWTSHPTKIPEAIE
jgi:hypothetical protein